MSEENIKEDCDNTEHRDREYWYNRSWRPFAAYVYMFICVCDFVLMPVYYEYARAKVRMDYVDLALKFPDGMARIEALRILQHSDVWSPLTLEATGLFHIAFGAILGVSAWTRSRDKLDDHNDKRRM